VASPPITIGPFLNVPAPGSPIRSDWPQQISSYVVVTDGVVQKLRAVNRQTTPLTFASQTIDTVGAFAVGNVTVPTKDHVQVLSIAVTMLLSAGADVDVNLYGPGAVLMRRARVRDTAGHPNGVSVAFSTGAFQAAGASGSNYAVKLTAISGTAAVAALGDASLNYLDITAFPAP